MHEVPSSEPYSRTEPVERLKTAERRSVPSLLRGPHGEIAELNVAIAGDGNLTRVNFWDLDKTLLWPKPVQFAAIPHFFPDVTDVDDLRKTFEAGWGLGTPYREFDRLLRIYQYGDLTLKDVEVYRKRFIADDDMRKKIDEEGHAEGWHERAFKAVADYSHILVETENALYEKDPSLATSGEYMNLPLMHLLEAKTRLGQVNVFMTANPGNFALRRIAHSGLYKYGLLLSPGEDMVGGGKELCIEKLIGMLQGMGLGVPKDRLVVIGDSARGDIESGYKVMQSGGYTFSGVLVGGSDELALFKEAAKTDPDLKALVDDMEMTLVASDRVPKGKSGQYKLGRLGSVVKPD